VPSKWLAERSEVLRGRLHQERSERDGRHRRRV